MIHLSSSINLLTTTAMTLRKHLLVVTILLGSLAPGYADTILLPVPPLLIKAELVNNLESGTTSPLIGIVSEDVLIDGKVLIPANSQIHGRTQAQAFRDRITCSGEFNLVSPHGRFVVDGAVLDRNSVGNDGSYGLIGIPIDLYGGFLRVTAGHKFYLYAQTIAQVQ